MRAYTLRDYVRQAGFEDIAELPIEAEFWKSHKLV